MTEPSESGLEKDCKDGPENIYNRWVKVVELRDSLAALEEDLKMKEAELVEQYSKDFPGVVVKAKVFMETKEQRLLIRITDKEYQDALGLHKREDNRHKAVKKILDVRKVYQ